MKGIIPGLLTSVVTFLVMFAFIFVATGFAPDECLIQTTSGECGGIAGFFPYPIRVLIFLAIVVYAIYLGIEQGKHSIQEAKFKEKNEHWLDDYRKKHNITPIEKIKK